MQASIVRRWLHELEAVNDLENLEPPRSLCQLPTNSKPESIRCRRNTEDTRRLSSASSHAARPLGRSTFFLVVVLPFARRMTQASLVAAHMGLLSGAHLRSMNWRGLWHELPGGAHRFACLVYPVKSIRRGLGTVTSRNYRRIAPMDGYGCMNRLEKCTRYLPGTLRGTTNRTCVPVRPSSRHVPRTAVLCRIHIPGVQVDSHQQVESTPPMNSSRFPWPLLLCRVTVTVASLCECCWWYCVYLHTRT